MRSQTEIGGRLTLTVVWPVGLFACLVGVEMYIGSLQGGVMVLVPEHRAPILQPIAILYGGYLAGILAFWYKPAQDDVASAVKISGFLSFLVAPATAYYFGSKSKPGE